MTVRSIIINRTIRTIAQAARDNATGIVGDAYWDVASISFVSQVTYEAAGVLLASPLDPSALTK